ncbi:hypothetical protein JD844_007775 [Phrynosoma platyrhinos]|uniref:Coiled-coil domain-containing protein n=1 Tax=Phrynosoma platyrhinos TaxID=52577 RepID=A0ABQ7T3S3_PHRPL|nr:hypothetical protein JD844_007775 [Phrynosoma platyrhinos]
MAKQLQEEEDRKARARIQERHKDIERQDCEIAQEIQVKLVIEAEQRRRQEEDDEGVKFFVGLVILARILQQKELQEEKRRKKPLPPEPISSSPYKEPYYPESRDRMCGSPRDQAPEHAGSHRPQNGDRQTQHPGDTWRGPPLLSEGMDLEVFGNSSEKRKGRSGQRRDRERQERKPGHPEKLQMHSLEIEDEDSDRTKERRRRRNPESLERPRAASLLDREDDHTLGGSGKSQERRPRSHERAQRPSRVLTEEDKWASSNHGDRHHRYRERRSPGSGNSLRPLSLDAEMEGRGSAYQRYGKSCSPNPDRRRVPSREGRHSPRAPSQDRGHKDSEVPPKRGRKRDIGKEYKGVVDRETPSSSSSHHGESREPHSGLPRNPGNRMGGGVHLSLANQVDTRAAQVAQDEHDTHEGLHPRSREGHEDHRAKSDKPTRPPPPPTEELDHLVSLTSQQNLAYPISKPEPLHKGYHYKQ